MTISSEVRKAGPYAGNDTASAFPFAFKVFSSTDVLVVRTDEAGNETILTEGPDYSVSLGANQDTAPGGSVLLPSPLGYGYSLTVASRLANLQPVDLTNQGGFYPRVINSALDRLTILVQQLAESVSRSLKVAISTPPGVSAELPAPVPYGILGWNGEGTGFINTDPSGASTLAADLASVANGKGGALVGYYDPLKPAPSPAYLKTMSDMLNGDPVSALRFVKTSETTAIRDFTSTYDVTADIQTGIDAFEDIGGGTLRPVAGKYNLSSTLRIKKNRVAVIGEGVNTLFYRLVGMVGDTLLVSAVDPTAETIYDVTVAGIKFDSAAAMLADAHLEVVEAAYCTLEKLSIQNGFIGMHLRGLRASKIDKLHIRSGQLYGGVQAGSRFLLVEDSPRALSTSENVEVLMSNFNFTANGAAAYVEYGWEQREADGFWAVNGHIRGASIANAFFNAAASPQLLGMKCTNVWFDGLTTRCLLIAGAPAGYAGTYEFTGCTMTGGTTHAVDIAAGAVLDTVTFNGGTTGWVDAQKAWNIAAGDNVVINGHTFHTLNASNAAASSAIAIAAGVGAVTVDGGTIHSSPNLDYGLVNNGTAQTTVNGVAFRDLAAAAKPVHLVNPATTRYASAGCTTDQATGYVLGNAQTGEFLNVADDTAVSVNLGEILGGIIAVSMKYNLGASGIVAVETADPAAVAIVAGGASLAVTTGVLSGTTGTDGKLTVAITDAGVLYFENRTGTTRNIIWRVLSRDAL